MSLTDQAILKIKEMIISGELRPGDRLPPEQGLSEKLGLSRSSLREAIKALTMFKVLDVRRGDGTYVTSLKPSLLTDAMAFVVDLHQDSSVLELMEARRVLEAAAVRRAATRITDEQVAALWEAIPSSEGLGAEELVEADLTFHRLLAQASGNDYLVGMLDGLSASTVRARIWRGLTEDNAVTRTIDEHGAIVRALEQHDPVLAEACLVVHIGGVEQWLRHTLTTEELADRAAAAAEEDPEVDEG
ncbi:FadR/GntR family transcriptional regulator [Ornithinicoccus hortensis]|uniref:GntR family transcriptional regulator n=1 Tax=Ornithinicoccus hortensis TaxID=82346 RepID=A0A542YLQ4_9MICO|nr:FadR/GntR family transcriptional regulator [Ornithinicoccus hortensis]TQL49003.1 GntR family transcriptional regulator [Ornithinicoccus hortensis]